MLASEYPSFDLTIIDQRTSDATRREVEAIAESDPRLRYEHHEVAGLSRAYNTGIAATSGEILAFTDDDCIAAPEWIGRIIDAFTEDPEADLLYGEVVPLSTVQEDRWKTPMLVFDGPARLTKRNGFKVIGMGANFAARRRLFDHVGPFDRVLGGGGALRSSQDFDMVYRTLHADRVVLLRPEISIRHDGKRESEDWPSLLLAYGTGDGGFYTKHIRCRDPRALWLFSKQFGKFAAKWLVKGVRGRKPMERFYVSGVLIGARDSFKFRIDRSARLYVEP